MKDERRELAYWRNAYETLVDQSGRDLNDGLGIDPRRADWPATSGRSQALRLQPSVEEVARVIREHVKTSDGRAGLRNVPRAARAIHALAFGSPVGQSPDSGRRRDE